MHEKLPTNCKVNLRLIVGDWTCVILFVGPCTRGVQYVMKTAQYIPKFYMYTLHN